MSESLLFRVHWIHKGKFYFDELTAATPTEAKIYFNQHKRDDVSFGRVELIGPDDGAVRETSRSPDSPFDPLIARRRIDKDEDAR